MGAGATAGAREPDFFAGIDTTIPGLFKALGRPEPAEAAALLQPIDAAVQEAMRTFNGRDPSAIVPVLARGLAAARVAATKLPGEPDAAFVLERKVEQFQMAINTALGLDLTAVAQPANVPEPTGPWRRVRAAAGDGRGRARPDVRGARLDEQPRQRRASRPTP